MVKQGLGATIGVLVLLLVMAMLPGGAFTADPDRVALVVHYADGQVDTLCIALGEDEITGADLLTRSGLDVIVDTSRMGITVCQIEGVGCAYPADACFCQCMGGDCAYWNYFYRDPGEVDWFYSALGAAIHTSRPGSVEAWVWGDGRTPPDDDLTFEAICLPPEPTASPTPLPPTSLPATLPPAETEPPILTPTRVLTRAPAHTPTALPTATHPPPSVTPTPVVAASQGISSTWFFGLALVGLAIAGAYVWLRRG